MSSAQWRQFCPGLNELVCREKRENCMPSPIWGNLRPDKVRAQELGVWKSPDTEMTKFMIPQMHFIPLQSKMKSIFYSFIWD